MRNRKQLEDSDHVVTSDPFGTFASKFAIGIRKFSDIAQIIQTSLPWSIFFQPQFCREMLKSCMFFIYTSCERLFHTNIILYTSFVVCISYVFDMLLSINPGFFWRCTNAKEAFQILMYAQQTKICSCERKSMSQKSISNNCVKKLFQHY